MGGRRDWRKEGRKGEGREGRERGRGWGFAPRSLTLCTSGIAGLLETSYLHIMATNNRHK